MINYITDFHALVAKRPNDFCKKIKVACLMIEKLLKRKDIHFKKGDVVAFEEFCNSLPHLKGRQWAGKNVELAIEQKWIIACILGIKQYSTTHKCWLRYFRELRLFVGRKWGKSLIISILAIWMQCFDRELGSEVYCFATNKKQARIVYDNIYKFIKGDKLLSSLIRQIQYEDGKALICDATNGMITYGSKAKEGKDGTNPHCFIIDEVHEVKNFNTYHSQTSGTGGRLQPMGVIISTAGTTKDSLYGFMYSQIEDMVQKKEFDDKLRIFFAVFEIDIDDDPANKKCWIKANPGTHDGRPSMEYLEGEYSKALLGESDMTTFLSKHLNRSCDDAQTYYTTDILCPALCDISSKHYFDSYAYGGVDLAEKTDLCSATIIIPYRHTDNHELFDYYILQKYWIPENRLDKNSEKDNQIYASFMKTKSKDEVCQQLVIASQGDSVNFNDVADWFAVMRDQYKLTFRKIGYDPANASQFVFSMRDRGFTVEQRIHDNKTKKLISRDDGVITEVRQGEYLSDMIDLSKVLFKNKRMRFDRSNALLPYCLTNSKVTVNNNNLKAVSKKQSNGRIDGTISMLCALRGFDCDKEKLINEVFPYDDRNTIKTLNAMI